jgi:outer membrane lipoprotein-sorting protein
MRWMLFAISIHLAYSTCLVAQPASAPVGVDPALWQQMVEINAKGAKVHDLTARFEQKKFTPLLKKPLISTGEVHVKGPVMRWDTKEPAQTVMRIDDKEVRLYYPQQKVVEIYKVDQQLSSLAASPLPRLDVLKEHFAFEKLDEKLIRAEGDPANTLALKLAPIDAALKEHVDEVRVLLDAEHGYILRFEMIDSDGDHTVISFTGIQTNTKLPDSAVDLTVASDVKVSRPLEAIEGK